MNGGIHVVMQAKEVTSVIHGPTDLEGENPIFGHII